MVHRVSARAAADLDGIWQYIAEERADPAAARRVTDAIAARFYLLSRRPFLGRLRPHLGSDIRSHPVGNYLIFYRVVDDDVLIVRVLHGRRDIGAVFRNNV